MTAYLPKDTTVYDVPIRIERYDYDRRVRYHCNLCQEVILSVTRKAVEAYPNELQQSIIDACIGHRKACKGFPRNWRGRWAGNNWKEEKVRFIRIGGRR